MSSTESLGLTGEQATEETAMTAIHAFEVRTGDVVEYRGTLHTVTHVDRHDGWAWPIAFDGLGWAIALGQELVLVDRAA